MEFSCHWSLHASVQEDMEDMVDVIEKLEAKYDTKYKSVRWHHLLGQYSHKILREYFSPRFKLD